jgi:hypothetical protein
VSDQPSAPVVAAHVSEHANFPSSYQGLPAPKRCTHRLCTGLWHAGFRQWCAADVPRRAHAAASPPTQHGAASPAGGSRCFFNGLSPSTAAAVTPPPYASRPATTLFSLLREWSVAT